MPEEYFEELGRRIAAAYISMEMGTTAETQYVGASTCAVAPYHNRRGAAGMRLSPARWPWFGERQPPPFQAL